jgi:hypothetical protein
MSELLSLPRMARRLKVSQSWLKREAEAGRIPSLSAGGRFLFCSAAVEKVLLERAQDAEGVRDAK